MAMYWKSIIIKQENIHSVMQYALFKKKQRETKVQGNRVWVYGDTFVRKYETLLVQLRR